MKILFKEKVYVSGSNGYHTYRIPSVIKTNEGTLLAFCEGRKESMGDSGIINILVKRSADNGRTWSDLTLIVTDGANNTSTATATVTVNDIIAPEVVTQNILVYLDENGQAKIQDIDILFLCQIIKTIFQIQKILIN